jgi:hypothetical protein
MYNWCRIKSLIRTNIPPNPPLAKGENDIRK